MTRLFVNSSRPDDRAHSQAKSTIILSPKSRRQSAIHIVLIVGECWGVSPSGFGSFGSLQGQMSGLKPAQQDEVRRMLLAKAGKCS